MATRVVAAEPEQVNPSTGTVAEMRATSNLQASGFGERLDAAHDWVYRRLQSRLEDLDTRFAGGEAAPIVVPLSPLRLGLDSEYIHRQNGWAFSLRPELEATLRLPNLERRFRLFITSTDLAESPGDPALESNPIRAGVRFVPRAHIDFDFGIRARLQGTAFAALKWAHEFDAGAVHVYPFAKAYVESGLGIGVSSGISLERSSGRWMVRSASFANWRHATSATDWTQTFLVGYGRAVIQERRYDRLASGHDLACGAAGRVSVSGDRMSNVAVFESSVIFKRPLRGGWLFGYVEPVVRWERASDWHPDAGIRAGFDILLWRLAALPTEVATYCR